MTDEKKCKICEKASNASENAWVVCEKASDAKAKAEKAYNRVKMRYAAVWAASINVYEAHNRGKHEKQK